MSAPLIVGGGPAGSAAAIALAGYGIRATLLERTAEPADALCGGFLSWRTLDTLARLGVEGDALGAAVVRRLRLFAGDARSEARLPHPARGVSRWRLDALLIAAAAKAGAKVERGVAVRRIEGERAVLADGAALSSPHVLLATGKHELRGTARDADVGDDPTLGLRIRLAPHPALTRLVDDTIELHLFAGGYGGLELQEDGSANFCMAVRRSRLREAGDAYALLAEIAEEVPPLADRLAHMASDASVDAVANVPYGWRASGTRPRLYRLGDQAAVIPSLAGEGMGIALASGMLAARAVATGASAEGFQTELAGRTRRPVGIAGLVRRLAERPWGAHALVALSRAPLAADMVARLTRISAP